MNDRGPARQNWRKGRGGLVRHAYVAWARRRSGCEEQMRGRATARCSLLMEHPRLRASHCQRQMCQREGNFGGVRGPQRARSSLVQCPTGGRSIWLHAVQQGAASSVSSWLPPPPTGPPGTLCSSNPRRKSFAAQAFPASLSPWPTGPPLQFPGCPSLPFPWGTSGLTPIGEPCSLSQIRAASMEKNPL